MAVRQQPRVPPPNVRKTASMIAYRNAKGPDIELGRLAFSAQKTGSIMEAVQIRLLFVDNNWSSIMVHVAFKPVAGSKGISVKFGDDGTSLCALDPTGIFGGFD